MTPVSIVEEIRHARQDFRRLVDEATTAELRRSSNGTRWTNDQLPSIGRMNSVWHVVDVDRAQQVATVKVVPVCIARIARSDDRFQLLAYIVEGKCPV